MDTEIQGKTVVAVGGANGIGLEICDKFLNEGAKNVIIIDIDGTSGNEAVTTLTRKHGEGKVTFIEGDVVTDLEKVFKIVIDQHKTIDVLVYSVGTWNDFVPKRMMDTRFIAGVEWSLKFETIMRKDKGVGNGGTILIISSIHGHRIMPFSPVYQACEYGLLGFTKSMGHERNFKKTGIRVLALCPGFTKTKGGQMLLDPEFHKPRARDFPAFITKQVWQDVNVVGDAAVEMFKKAQSGVAWMIEGGKLSEC